MLSYILSVTDPWGRYFVPNSHNLAYIYAQTPRALFSLDPVSVAGCEIFVML